MRIGDRIVRRARVGSTMDLLDELARAGAPAGLVVLAEVQDAGRGRAGRSWIGAAGGIYCSVLLRPAVRPDRIGTLSLVVGVGVAEALERIAAVRCGLKWPNDVQIAGRKVAGILVQSRLSSRGVEYANVGIGINVAQTAADVPPEGITLRDAADDALLEPGDVLPVLFEELTRHLEEWETADGRPSLDGWRSRAVFLGESVEIVQDGARLSGVFTGVDDDGHLLLATSDGRTVTVVQGDLVGGPRLVRG